jgi:hypothetical protein
MLAYQDGNFIQVLEGPDEAVHELFEVIRKDDRHKGAIALLNNQTDQRQFPDWSMAFQNLNDPALREPSRAHRLLEIFRRNTKR